MYKRDIAIVLLSCFALFLSVQREGSISFRKAWWVDSWMPHHAAGALGATAHNYHGCTPRYHVLSEDQRIAAIDNVDALPRPLVVGAAGACMDVHTSAQQSGLCAGTAARLAHCQECGNAGAHASACRESTS